MVLVNVNYLIDFDGLSMVSVDGTKVCFFNKVVYTFVGI